MDDADTRTVPVGIDPARYPTLRLLCWSGAAPRSLSREDAFALYEREWRFVEEASLTDEERALIASLAREFGGGLINA